VTVGEAGGTVQRAPKRSNNVLRGIRESRKETRAQFAEAMARVARETGEKVCPDENYVQRLESGSISWPNTAYRNILVRLCNRPAIELGFTPPMLSACGSDETPGHVNIPLRDAIWASGMELNEFARKVGVAPKTAERWITRGRIPRANYRWKASRHLGREESELWPQGEELTEHIPAIGASVPETVEDVVDVVDVLSRIQKVHRSTVHPDIIRQLRDSIRNTVLMYENLDHSTIYPSLRKQRTLLESLIDECGHPAQRAELFEIAGATSGVLGYVAVGRGEFPLARAYCLEAFQLGDFAGDANLQAWARGLQSFCEYYAGRYGEALALANDGLSYAQSGPQSVRLTINGAARTLGKLGDAKGVDRAVGEAYELMSVNDVPHGVPSSISLGCYSAAQTASNAATAYVSLEMPEKVRHYVGLALPEISKSDSPWSRSLVLIDLAFSEIRAREADLDHATALVQDALSISAGRPIISVQQRTQEFVRGVVERWGNVRQPRAILEAVSAVSTAISQGE
jgi:transcriptional regulator with XRE-family HTH domain